jgi:TolB-like protein/DNA-binding winged helix-turn-helix (wHTH) protein/Tfp pilus assembly protein PilF
MPREGHNGANQPGLSEPVPDTERTSSNEAFLVHDLHVDMARQRVTRAGVEITLPYLSFQLLAALIRAAPHILSNDEIMARVWPGLVVSPETVAKRVNLLRDVLGDDAQDPRYVAGVRGRGYRLVAATSRATAPEPIGDEPAPASPLAPNANGLAAPVAPIEAARAVATKTRRSAWRALLVAFLVIAAITIGLHIARKPGSVGEQQDIGSPLRATGTSDVHARTVAVLPFDNISADANDAYLSQGLPEMILNRMSRIEGLSVIARNSSFSIQTRDIDSREIGRRLNSGYLITGSVQRESDRLRVTVHLVDTSTGTLVWSAHFDRGLHEIFSVEDEIADQIADALSARIGAEAPMPAAGARSANLEAYLAFLRGRTLLGRFTVAESESAMPYFEKAIALDPSYAPAYASLYDAKMQAADKRREDMKAARERNRHLIDRSIELDPGLGAAYFARAMWGDAPYDASATPKNPLVVARDLDFRRGMKLDPSNGRGLEAYATFLFSTLERPEEGRRVLDRALWVDPMSPSPRFSDADLSLFEGGVRVSEQKMLRVLELDPNFVPALHRYGQYRWLIDGKLAEAAQIIEHAIALDPDNSLLLHRAMAIYLDLGDERAARAVIARLSRRPGEVGLLAMYKGDWQRAGVAAYDEANWAGDSSDSDICELWQGLALRDYALKTGELERAIAFIKSKYYFGDAPAAHLEVCNFRAAVYLSQLMAAGGEAGQAVLLRRAASSWNDANEEKYLGDSHRMRATVLLLDGKQDEALAELAKSFQLGYYAYWWYTLEHDPMWLPLHGDARFRAIAADVHGYIDAQRSQLEALRRQGDVPRRAGATNAH